MIRFLVLGLICVCLFAACSPGTSDEPVTIPNDEGGALLVEATRAAQRAISERKTATIQYATMNAESTRQTTDRQATGTAQAVWANQQRSAAQATDNALSIQSAQTRQAATDTAVANHSQATGTAESQSQEIAGTRTAGAVKATETTYAATSTRSAQELQAALERNQATATAEALYIRRDQAQEDAARSQRWSDFLDTLLKIMVGIGGIALLAMLIIQLARYLDAIALRQRLVETRSGTVLMVVSRGQTSAQIIKPFAQPGDSMNLLTAGDEFEETQAPVIREEADDLLKVKTSRGETFIAKTDPEEEAREARRKLALRLLRESMRYYAGNGFDVPRINRIPPSKNLEWSSETWVRAVNALKPYVITKQGRGGGTYCGEQFPTLMQLYSAIGERRIFLDGPEPVSPAPKGETFEERSPSPTLAAVAA